MIMTHWQQNISGINKKGLISLKYFFMPMDALRLNEVQIQL